MLNEKCPMQLAIFSDLHDNRTGLTRVLRDAEQHQADRVLYLGDVGHDPWLFAALAEHVDLCLFGNWEVSGLTSLPAEQRRVVGQWPATVTLGTACFCHATPAMPAQAATTAQAAHLMQTGMTWHKLFPRLDRNEAALWTALAELEEGNQRVAFHGHTHVQHLWAWTNAGAGARRLTAHLPESEEYVLTAGAAATANRYVIGVGSAGQPQDGPDLRYVLYDDRSGTVRFRRLAP